MEWLENDFKALDSLQAGVCEQIMRFIATGAGEEVLQTVAGTHAASGGLALRCRLNANRSTPERDRFFSSTTIRDPAFHLRLGLVYEAASQSSVTGGRRVAVAPGLQGGAEFLDVYLWEALRVSASVWPRKPMPSALSALEIEKMLELHGNPPSWIVRGALVIDVGSHGWLNHSGILITSVPGFGEALQRHVPMVRECLQQTDHRCKIHAIEVLKKAAFAPSHCADLAAELAVNSAKGVRDVTEAWISAEPESVLPLLRKIAVDAGPAERFLAVKLLAKIGGQDARAFLEDRLAEEKSRKVTELIEGLLNPQSHADLAAAEQSVDLPALPALPDLLADQTLDASVLADLQDVIEKSNAQWLANWQKIKGQKWAPKEPMQLPPGTAEKWFAILQTPESGVRPTKAIGGDRFNPSSVLTDFAAHPKFKLVHVVRWCALLQPGVFSKSSRWLGSAAACLDARIQKHGPIDYREIAHICQHLGFDSEWIARAWLMSGSYNATLFTTQPASAVWGYFSERLSLLEKALGWTPSHDDFVSKYLETNFRTNAWRALAAFPVPPPSFLDRMWEVALGSSKTERPLAQEALLRAPNRDARIIAALSSGQQEQRCVAADWLGRLKIESSIPALRAAIAKEKYDTPKAMMIGALERLGVSPDEFLDRAGLLKEAKKTTSKPAPTALAWFPMAQLPAVHWSDNGKRVAPEIVQAWLIQACKLKQAEPSALVRRYAANIRAEERETLGQFILDAWMAEDVIPNPRPVAESQAMASAQSLHQSAQQYPQYFPQYQGMPVEQIYARLLPGCLEVPKGSANDSKGILAVAGACVGASAAAPVGRYLKKWYGTRVHQARALLQMLAWVDHPAATQTLLAIGTRFRTKSLQQEATRLAQGIAERKGWSLAELADRTIPAAGLDDDGVLELDFGPRQFTARLGPGMNLMLFDPEGKAIKSLPDPRKDDDAEKAAAAKKLLGVTRKELKQVIDQQRVNLYEAMCVQRTWRFEDWEPFLCRHPVVRHFCQRLVWTATRDGVARLFRPLADGSLTDVEDNAFKPDAADAIAIAHLTTTTPAIASAWIQHFSDYEVAPLFDQFGRGAPEMTPEKKAQRELKDFEGWMEDTFKIRGRATKLGYARGPTGDGGWFREYVKRFPTTGLQAVIEFTGSALPETNIPAALTRLTFSRENAGHISQPIALGEVPAVLLAECWNDYRQIAADGSGFDPGWEKKAGW
jgi:hypothetical protein